MSSPTLGKPNNNVEHSQPIPIHGHSRRRSDSVSETSSSPSSSSDSAYSPSSPISPPFSNHNQPRVAPLSPTNSPILSYFLGGQSPKSPAATFPFRRNFGSNVFEEEAEPDPLIVNHGRRASMASWPPVPPASAAQPQSQPQIPENKQDRAAGLFRRLSLGGALARPQVPQPPKPVRANTPPNSPAVERSVSTSVPGAVPSPRKTRRSHTLASGTARPRRAPSPMGERILKGQFDGFN